MKKIIFMLSVIFILTGCEIETKSSCEDRGGEWVSYSYITTTYVNNTRIPTTNYYYLCEGLNEQ